MIIEVSIVLPNSIIDNIFKSNPSYFEGHNKYCVAFECDGFFAPILGRKGGLNGKEDFERTNVYK